MKKFSFILFSLLSSMVLVAQNDCQEIVHSITSSTHTANIVLDEATGNSRIYYDLCIGEELILEASATFPENDLTYTQSIASTEFSWSVDGAFTTTGLEYAHIYNTSSGYIVSITSTDVEGCENPIPFEVFVRVSTQPTINLLANPSTICPDVISLIGNDPASDVNINIDYITDGWGSTACEDEYSEETYLPDDNGTEVYSTTINLGCFGEGQVLTDVDDIISIDVNMEHSYSGDLDMFITAPNGVQIQLFSQAGGGTWFGEPLDDWSIEDDGLPGIGYDYGWSMNPSYNGTMADGISNGNTISITTAEGLTGNSLNPETYLPLESLTALLGTPLNGIWEITIIDNLGSDDGFIFSWGLNINADVIPSFWNYDNHIVDEYWMPNSTIQSTNGTDLTILPTNPGLETYTYIIEDNFGCTYSEDLNLTVTTHVNASASVTNDICGAGSGQINLAISGGTPNYLVDWNNGSFTGQNLINASADDYTYTITDAIGCEFTGEETVLTEIIELEFDTNSINDICDDEVGKLTIVPTNGYSPYNYSWNIANPNSPIANNIGEGTYIVAVTDHYGCEGIAIGTVDNQEIELQFDFTSEYDHCDQDIGSATVIPLNGLAPYSYNWDNGFADNATAADLNDGEYDVIVTDSHGCEGETTVEVINIPGPTSHFDSTFDTVVYNAGLVEFLNFSFSEPSTSIISNQWSFGEGTFSNAFEPSNVFDQIGVYHVELTVTDSEGCVDSYIKEIVAKEDYLFWPPTAFTPNGDNKNDEFRPLLKDIIKDSYEMYIYDRWGKLVFQTKDYLEGWDGVRIDNGAEANQNSYTYLVLFNTKKNIIQKKTGTFVLLK